MTKPNILNDPNARICAVCGRVLDRAGTEDGRVSVWFHVARPMTPEFDHDPVPVQPDNAEAIRFRCDFCDVDVPLKRLWVLPCNTFSDAVVRTRSITDWAACPSCAMCIKGQDWDRLISRVMTIMEGRGIFLHRSIIAAFYDPVRENQAGPIHLKLEDL